MSIDTTNPRVRRQGNDYEVLVNGRWYLVEEDDRLTPPVWRAYVGEEGPDKGFDISLCDDPLANNRAACADYMTAEGLIAVLLACESPRTV